MRDNNHGKKSLVMIGLEEEMEIDDYGERSRMISFALSQSERVGKLMVIYCPIFLARRASNSILHNRSLSNKYSVLKKSLLRTIYEPNQNYYLYAITSPFPESFIAKKKYYEYLKSEITNDLDELGFNDYALWITNPRIITLARLFDAKSVLFDAIDNLLVHPQFIGQNKNFKDAYHWVDKNADLIIYASENQKSMFPENRNHFVFPNGVDGIFFNPLNSVMPEDMKDIPRPIVGYVGMLQDRFDVKMMEEVIAKSGNYSFVFVGPVHDEDYFSGIMKFPNTYFLGKKKFSSIPSYIHQFDIGIIPHKINEFTESMDPLKIYEYLSMGKIVITTSIAGSDRFKSYIKIANDPDSFNNAIDNALVESRDEKTKSLIKTIGYQNSWDYRINSVLDKLDELV